MGCCGDGEDEKGSSGSPIKRNVCCTDIIFLIIFIAFWGGMIYVAAFSIMQGDAKRIIFGYDSYGNTCDRANNVEIPNITNSGIDTYQKSNVFFSNIFDPFDSMQLCVAKCPREDLMTPSDVYKFAKDNGSRLCSYEVDVEDYNDANLYNNDGQGPCPDLPVYRSISLLNRCVPDLLAVAKFGDSRNLTKTVIKLINADDIFRRVLADLFTSWKEMLALCFVALGFSLIMVFMMRFLAPVIVWVIVVLAALGSIAGTAFLWWTYVQARKKRDKNETMNIPILDIDVSNERAFLVFSIVATVLTVILLLILLIMRKRFALVVALFKEAGKAVQAMPILLIQPLWTFLILIAFLVYWVVILAYISTAGYPTPNYDKDFISVKFEPDRVIRILWWYHVIGLIWTSEFILGCQQFVVAGSVATWYFSRNKKSLECPVGKATCRLILHHLGTIAFGSFIILLVKLPRMILMYIQSKCKGSENKCAQCCLKCCICCLWCLEKLLKFLNQNAYTITAIKGLSFCPAAKKAFTTIASNVLRVAAINSVGDFVLFLGKIGVMAATAAVGIVWLKNYSALHYYAVPVLLVSAFGFLVAHCGLTVYESKEGLHYYAIPVLLICVFGFLIAHCFLSVFEMVIDTLLLCFCEDCQMNDGTEGREYYMSTSLMEFVKDSSGKLNKLDNRKDDQPDGPENSEKEPLPTAV